jgi:hypothetical protein
VYWLSYQIYDDLRLRTVVEKITDLFAAELNDWWGENDRFFIFRSKYSIADISLELSLLIDSEVDTVIIGDLGKNVILIGSNSDPEVLTSLIQEKDELPQ